MSCQMHTKSKKGKSVKQYYELVKQCLCTSLAIESCVPNQILVELVTKWRTATKKKLWNLKFYHDLYTSEQGKKIGQLINVTPRWVAPQLTDTRLPHATIQLKIKQ